jgi:hypothetical protein
MISLWKLASERKRLQRRNEPQKEVSKWTSPFSERRIDILPAQAARRKKQAAPEPEPEPEPIQQRGDDDGDSLYASE